MKKKSITANFRSQLDEICNNSGTGTCPGCGLTTEGLDKFLEYAYELGVKHTQEESSDIFNLLTKRIEVLKQWPDTTGYVAGGIYELERCLSLISNNAVVDFHVCVDCGRQVSSPLTQCSECRVQL